ncbi:MAG: SpoIIE family protein phosphatase [Planctomycetota bacterium]|jgi:serine phosphatase RsbU (regulator of sigma subunit)|nr:SpoIIE family protein phosphatase [Planctomycetota bacterium]
MTESGHEHDLISSALATIENSEIFSPGIFDNTRQLLANGGFASAGIYLVDDYPDTMRLVTRFGHESRTFPEQVPIVDPNRLAPELLDCIGPRPGLSTHPLFTHGRYLGAVAVIGPEPGKSFLSIIKVMSVLAYIEIVRANTQRERMEKEVYFAQSLTNRLLMRPVPQSKHFRAGYELWRSLEVGGDFFDFVPVKDGRMYAFIGRCSGQGVKTVFEMVEIMHHIDRCFVGMESMTEIAHQVNEHLVQIKKRSHLASLCLLEFNPLSRSMRLVKAGNFAMTIIRPDSYRMISDTSGPILGMVKDLEMEEEIFEFKPGWALFCATEGITTIRDSLDQSLPASVVAKTVENTMRERPVKALINEAFERIRLMCDNSPVHDAFAAISVEFLDE